MPVDNSTRTLTVVFDKDVTCILSFCFLLKPNVYETTYVGLHIRVCCNSTDVLVAYMHGANARTARSPNKIETYLALLTIFVLYAPQISRQLRRPTLTMAPWTLMRIPADPGDCGQPTQILSSWNWRKNSTSTSTCAGRDESKSLLLSIWRNAKWKFGSKIVGWSSNVKLRYVKPARHDKKHFITL